VVIDDDPRLSQTATERISHPETKVFVSVVSAWEIVIKQRTGKLEFGNPVSSWWRDTILRNNIDVLDITSNDVLAVEPLPLHHRDPFDRLLIAQAITHDLELVSGDSQFDAYPVRRIW
jgi:PIN domain nuclease of toxin-antitoxin system